MGFDDHLTDPREPLTLDGVATAVAFLLAGPVKRLRRIRPGPASYSWKHRAELWGRAMGLAPYVSNGELLAACLALGIPVRRIAGTPNAHVAIGLSDPEAFDELRDLA